ncbi:MAG: peptidoglycan DD-metalloendopeptidase family protein [Proteobacteria bacterium]|nr:peptidoglycan DD-metalloendopeptidase family protein [Pseudomonadota bacterium]MBU6424756.1 peptidoglycan DD-metalloendopeptidase family protein [Rhodospirillales bacterium]
MHRAALAALWLGLAAAPPASAKDDAASLRARREATLAEMKAHQQAEAAAAAHRAAVAAKATALAHQQAQAAAALRGLEDQTSQDAARLAQLFAQQNVAAARLNAAEATLKKLLPVMQRLSAAPAGTLLAAPLAPCDAVRSIAILQGLAAQVAAQANAVKTETATLAAAIAQAQSTRLRLDAAVTAQQAAEAKLSIDINNAMADEQADSNQAVAQAAAAARAKHELSSLDEAVTRLVPKVPPHATPVNIPAGGAGAPVAGHIVQAYGAQTVAGPSTGISYAAAPGARVTSPCGGTVMYAGPLPSYGNVVIADCGGGLSAVLAGMNRLDVAQGQHVVHGQPLGSMQAFDPTRPAHQPRLYVELRRDGTPVDPTSWLASGHSG